MSGPTVVDRDRQQAIQYLRSHRNGYWYWTEDGQVLAWRDGTTLAFRQEIAQILTWLAPHGLPPFGALVLLLAAGRGKFPSKPQPTPALNDAVDVLMRVPSLPAELRTGLKARCVLAEAVFESIRPIPHVDARQILRGLAAPILDDEMLDSTTSRSQIAREILQAGQGLKPHTAESLALRIRTGLDALPAAPDPEAKLPPAERARRLIEELSHDPEYGPVARAARDLLAATRLPRQLEVREDLPLGGVSDITNRGPLDRLLLSELAHDDLTLAVRVALNEALYLRREPPQREPPGTLALLLDSGVRLWGVPRVLATAVALALVARDRHGGSLLAWRAGGGRLHAVDLLSRKGLTEHLGTLETEAHVGGSLAAFGQALPANTPAQAVVITHRDTLGDPEFRSALAEHSEVIGFVATVTREGQFELHTLPLSRRPPVCQAELDLEKVFLADARKAAIPMVNNPDLPAIFGYRPFPFLLPMAGRLEFWHKRGDGTFFGVLSDRRLIEFRGTTSGGRVVAPELPAGKTLWMDEVDGIVHLVKAGTNQRPPRLISCPLPVGPLQVTDLTAGAEFTALHRQGNVLLAITPIHVHAYALDSGRPDGRRMNPYRHVGGRYLRGDKHFYVVTWNGEIQLDELTLPARCEFENVIKVFDREGMEGPWIINCRGGVFSPTSSTRFHLRSDGDPSPIGEVFVSRDGHRVLDNGTLLDLNTMLFRNLDRTRCDEFDPVPLLPSWNLFRVLDAIAILDDGLALLGRKGQWRKLGWQRGAIRIVNDPSVVQVMRAKTGFSSPGQRTPHGCTLQLAQWPNGAQVHLDSRGLLHLRGADPAQPEISLVLSDGEVAGWTSDGHRCGPKFFFDGPIESDPETVFECVQRCLLS